MNGKRRGRMSWGAVCRLFLSLAAVSIATILWVEGLWHSPLLDPRRLVEKQFSQDYLQAKAPDAAQERILAESYWRRYHDVRADAHWGEGGPMGIWGPRDHFRQHGRREGRIFRPLIEPPDLKAEKILAEAYWARYPEIRHDSIWGEHSDLGILGPRDHYTYIGAGLGFIWGQQIMEADRR